MLTPLFDFVVGSEKRSVKIHSGLIKRLSPPLWALISNGKMKESITKTASLEGVELGTFLGFAEFAYRGRYTTPSREDIVVSDPLNDMNATLLEEQNFFYYDEGEANPGSRCPYQAFWEHFLIQRFDGEEASKTFAPDLIFHAKLYVFATQYLIQPLQQQCLKSLHRDLRLHPLDHQNADHILDLLEYSYEHTGKQEPGGPSALRKLVISYVTCRAQALLDEPRFNELLNAYAEIGADLVVRLA